MRVNDCDFSIFHKRVRNNINANKKYFDKLIKRMNWKEDTEYDKTQIDFACKIFKALGFNLDVDEHGHLTCTITNIESDSKWSIAVLSHSEVCITNKASTVMFILNDYEDCELRLVNVENLPDDVLNLLSGKPLVVAWN